MCGLREANCDFFLRKSLRIHYIAGCDAGSGCNGCRCRYMSASSNRRSVMWCALKPHDVRGCEMDCITHGRVDSGGSFSLFLTGEWDC
jgi:hypothetical protein